MELHQVQLLATQAGGFGVKLASETRTDRVVIKQLQPGGPAEVNGLQPGDVVVGIGGQQVTWRTLQAVLSSARSHAGDDGIQWSVWRARQPAGKGSPGWCWGEFVRRMLIVARDRQRQTVAALQREVSWQPDDAPGSWIWCWRQFARAVLSASRPSGIVAAEDGDAANVVVAGTWAWCWELFVRGMVSLHRRPRVRPRLKPPPQVFDSRTSRVIGYDPSFPATAISIDDEDDRTEFLVEIRKLARPDPPYGWLSGPPPVSRTAHGDSLSTTATEHEQAESVLHYTHKAKHPARQRIQRSTAGRLPDGSGFLPARRSTRHQSDAFADRPAMAQQWSPK